jgi:hypothetical protein
LTVGYHHQGVLEQWSISSTHQSRYYRTPVGARFSAPIHTGPGAHPASYTMGTDSIPGGKEPGHGLATHPHLALRLKKEFSYTFTPPLGLRGLF